MSELKVFIVENNIGRIKELNIREKDELISSAKKWEDFFNGEEYKKYQIGFFHGSFIASVILNTDRDFKTWGDNWFNEMREKKNRAPSSLWILYSNVMPDIPPEPFVRKRFIFHSIKEIYRLIRTGDIKDKEECEREVWRI